MKLASNYKWSDSFLHFHNNVKDYELGSKVKIFSLAVL